MSYVLPLTSTQDKFDDNRTLSAPGSRRLVIHAYPPVGGQSAGVVYQLGDGARGVVWGQERFMPPGTLARVLTFDAIRVRSAKAGAPQTVTVEAETY